MELEATHHIVRQVEACLVKQALPGRLVHLTAHELNFSANFLSRIASVLDLETRTHGSEVFSETKVPAEHLGVSA